MKKTFFKISAIITAVFVAISGIAFVLITQLHFSAPQKLKSWFEHYLTEPGHLPYGKADAIYILGGSGTSTNCHIIKAAQLYREGKTDRILIFDSKVKWHYEPALGRNTTRNELSISMLLEKGVPLSAIDSIPFHEGFFGTLSEARALSRYLKSKQFSSVILLTSPCHTRRVLGCFTHFLSQSGISIYIAASKDPFSFSELILETIKVFVYKVMLYFK